MQNGHIWQGPGFYIVAPPKAGSRSIEDWCQRKAHVNLITRCSENELAKSRKRDQVFPVYAAWRDPYSRAVAGIYEGLTYHSKLEGKTKEECISAWLENPSFVEKHSVKWHTTRLIDQVLGPAPCESFNWFHYSHLNKLPDYINRIHHLSFLPMKTKNSHGDERDKLFGKDFKKEYPHVDRLIKAFIHNEFMPNTFLDLDKP